MPANKQSENREIAENHAIKLISLKRNDGVGSFYGAPRSA